MTQNDYILREIERFALAVSKLVFHKDATFVDLIEENGVVEQDDLLEYTLREKISRGQICEAEDLLFEALSDAAPSNFSVFSAAADFYRQLSTCSDEFLNSCNFPRDEIIQGLADVQALLEEKRRQIHD